MTQIYLNALLDFQAQAAVANIRIPVIIEGDRSFHESMIKEVSDALVISDDPNLKADFSWRQGIQCLGQEFDTVIFDCAEIWHVNALCAVAGALNGGSLAIFLVFPVTKNASYFNQRMYQFFLDSDVVYLRQNGKVNLDHFSKFPPAVPAQLPSQEQQEVIKQIHRVLTGHRRRPLIIVADRGRGKSAGMGIAVGEILKHQAKTILVTAPTLAQTGTLFEHAEITSEGQRANKHLLTTSHGGQLQFVAPDHLLRESPKADLLLVDEAAAIPVPMLQAMVQGFSRVVFASTEHGYEGSGRGFTSRFFSFLDLNCKQWHLQHLHTPIRYASCDPLETWLFRIFLFEADTTENSPQNERYEIQYRTVSQRQLFKTPQLLRQVFHLLVSAHYQTSPSELQQLLDDPQQHLICAFYNERIVGLVLGQIEGGFEPKLAKAVMNGQRRLKGHLLPQSLAMHIGLTESLEAPLLRITRVAIDQNWRRSGIGSQLVEQMALRAQAFDVVMLGTSFSASGDLLAFWQKNEFRPVRIGVTRDIASGCYSLQMLRPLNDSMAWIDDCEALFFENFIFQLGEQFQELDPLLVQKIMSQTVKTERFTALAFQQLTQFSKGILGYDLLVASLFHWVCFCLKEFPQWCQHKEDTVLVIAKVLQRKDWQALGKTYQINGRKLIEQRIQSWVKKSLDGFSESRKNDLVH